METQKNQTNEQTLEFALLKGHLRWMGVRPTDSIVQTLRNASNSLAASKEYPQAEPNLKSLTVEGSGRVKNPQTASQLPNALPRFVLALASSFLAMFGWLRRIYMRRLAPLWKVFRKRKSLALSRCASDSAPPGSSSLFELLHPGWQPTTVLSETHKVHPNSCAGENALGETPSSVEEKGADETMA